MEFLPEKLQKRILRMTAVYGLKETELLSAALDSFEREHKSLRCRGAKRYAIFESTWIMIVWAIVLIVILAVIGVPKLLELYG